MVKCKIAKIFYNKIGDDEMKKTFTKIISCIMVVLMLIFSVPVGQFADLDWSAIGSIFDFKAEAAGAQVMDLDFSPNEYMASIILNTNIQSCAISDTGKSVPSMTLDYYTQLENVSLSKCATDPLEADIDFMASVAAWEALTFSPTDIYSDSLDKIGYYQAILFEILGVAVEYNFIPKIVKQFDDHVISMLKANNDLSIKLDGVTIDTGWSIENLTLDQQHQLIQNTSGHMSKLEMRNQTYSDFTMLLKTCDTVADFIEKAAQLTALVTLSEDVKAVVNELYSNCVFIYNPELKTAISEIKGAMDSRLDNISVIGLEILSTTGKLAMDKFLDMLWGEMAASVLGGLLAGALIGQVIGKGISNILFATEDMLEQFYMIQALEAFEELMCNSVKSLGRKYQQSPNLTNANVFMSSVNLLYNTYKIDLEYTIDFFDCIYEKGLINRIKVFLNGEHSNFTQVKNTVSSFNNTMSSTLGMLGELISYCWYLEVDHPDVFQAYYGDMSYEALGNKYTNVVLEKTRLLKVACPTDVDVYDANGELVVSIRKNVINICKGYNLCSVEDDEKYLVIPANSSSITITGTDSGEMTYTICEASKSGFNRTIIYDDVVLEAGCTYSNDLPEEINSESKGIQLVKDDNEIIQPNYDSFGNGLAPVNVARALFFKNSFIDIKKYKIPVTKAADVVGLAKIYFKIVYGYSCDGTFSYDVVYDSHKNTIVKFKFNYGTDLDSTAPANTIDAEVNVLNEIKAYTNGMSDFDKAIYIHDYLILNGEYDIELGEIIEKTGTLTEELRKERYEKYALLVNGTGVCDTYASAYQYLMTNCGVECITVSSTAMNHAWNMVKLNGSWYHVDCTWDDPVADRVGLSRYDFFLLNTNEMKANEHYSWSPSYTSTSSTYSAITRDDTDEVSYGEGHWCYYENGDLYYSDVYGKNAVKITDMDFAATDIYNGNIYGVIGKIIYKINVADSSKNAQAIYALEEAPRAIYIDKNGILEYYTNGRKSFETVDLNNCAVVESLTISADTNVIRNGEDLQLKVVAHTNGYDIDLASDAVIWSSSDLSVATVDSYGIVTPDVAGTVVITAAFGNITADFTVEVEKWEHTIGGSIANGVSWSFDEDTGTLSISGNSDIQNFISDKETPWYKYRSRIVKLEIADGIKSIGEYAFSGLNKIKYIKVPDSVNTINEYAFNGCDSVEKIEIPFVGSSRTAYETEDAVLGYIFGKTNDGTTQYYKTDGTYIYGYQYAIPSGIKEIIITDADKISYGAFYGSAALEYLELNDDITFIGERILTECPSVVSLKVPFIGSKADANGDYDSVVGYFFGGADKTGVLQYTSYADVSGSIQLRGYHYNIPQTFKNIEVTNDADIPMCAFSALSFDKIVLSEKTTEIGELAFFSCSNIGSLMILNRSCNIIDTFNMAQFSGTVYGYSNSTAQSFAAARNLKFVALDGTSCPHSYGLWSEKVAATCDTQGVEHRICGICGNEETRATSVLGHNYSNSWTVDVKATCEGSGSKSRHCSRCSAKTDVTSIAPTGHSYGQWESKIEATCTSDGLKARTCAVCQDEETEVVKASGHTPESDWTIDKEATCEGSGSKSKHCSVCSAKTDITSIAPKGHSYGQWESKQDATCTADGFKVRTCTVCQNEETEVVKAGGHTPDTNWTIDKDASCTSAGSKSKHCLNCGEKLNITTIPAKGHSFGSWVTVTDATCDKTGLQKRTCQNCSEERTRTLSATGHKYEAVESTRVEATCTKDGKVTYRCYCGNSYTETIAATGHSYGKDDETCKICDYDRTEDCDCNCHKTGFSKIIFKIVLFFQKIFKSNQECACGIYHY